MSAAPQDHERALLLVLKSEDAPAAAFQALVAHPDVATWHLPAPWSFERAGVDLPGALPGLGTITLERLDDVLPALARLCTKERLQELAQRVWLETDEQVRGFFLQRPMFETLASIVRMAPKSKELPPPRDFVQGQIFMHRFEMEYRLHRAWEKADPVAPAEEGSLIFYPFDPSNEEARREADLGEGRAVILEAFAYGPARDRHRKVLEDVAGRRGWRVVDSGAPA